MPYIIIEDFRAGLDRRKMAAASVQGSLQACTNAHITRGGEIEKRLAFVSKYALPAGQTYGLAGAAGTLYTFGSVASPAVPSGVTYQRLQNSTETMNALVEAEFFDGQIFAIATYGNGDHKHFYNGTVIAHFAGGSGTNVAGKLVTNALTFGDKMYGIAGSVLYFSTIANATSWNGTGSGFKNMSTHAAGSETLTGLGRYQDLMAVFSRNNIQLWTLDADAANNVQRQILSKIGTYAPKSIVPFGEIDVFFLADTGIRSLRARSSSDRAGVTDVGTPIDDELKAYLATLSEAQRAAAVGAIEPSSGRFMGAVGQRCYVFSHFPDARISAWSRYDLGFEVSDFVSDNGKLWARSGNTVYLLGGDSGGTYDSSRVTVELPFIDGRQIATFKQWTGFDIVCEGEWAVYVNTDPTQPDTWTQIGIVTGTSVQGPSIAMQGHSPVLALKLVNEKAGAAKLSKIIVHYQEAESN